MFDDLGTKSQSDLVILLKPTSCSIGHNHQLGIYQKSGYSCKYVYFAAQNHLSGFLEKEPLSGLSKSFSLQDFAEQTPKFNH